MTVPRQSISPDESTRLPEDHRHMVRRRWLTAIIIVLLVGIPAGYLVISAEQSRDSGRDKESESSATGLRDTWPSQMKRRVFEVPIPERSTHVAYYETSNWKTSRLYVQFRTTSAGLDRFLKGVGTSRAQLDEGEVSIAPHDAETVAWDFGASEGEWAGTSHVQKDPRPTQDVTVDLTDKSHPMVYVVSTATP
ncbi:hypothetical protein FBY35_1435 [Streptomyces sp. SLBN-118]|uniref:hypothetical protein n=1 Tax=Streptomyces sp. SLBN-118 TaxID=2768454 RepID=UPI001166DB66|nr:hypothetical protein [Streptomyces sp. SLBN-118]TQK51048.1 hypothetical protein FBY35_1435 [Streptomyces sp. SLBN-118]